MASTGRAFEITWAADGKPVTQQYDNLLRDFDHAVSFAKEQAKVLAGYSNALEGQPRLVTVWGIVEKTPDPWERVGGLLLGPIEDGRRFVERDDENPIFPTDEKAAQHYATENGYSYERQYLSDNPNDFRVYVIVDGSDDL